MDNVLAFFENTQTIGPIDLLINIILAALFSYFVYLVYIKCSTTISGKSQFGSSFLLITVCTALIIALIKSSVALSLGLVGALSIVRFRTAIKEPEELTYLFLCIAIGLGFGANERLITSASAVLILIIIIIKRAVKGKKENNSFNFTVRTSKMDVEEVVDVANKYFKNVILRRYSKSESGVEVFLEVEIKNLSKLSECSKEFSGKDKSAGINFLESRL